VKPPGMESKAACGVTRRGCVTVEYELIALNREDAGAFAALAARGAREVERLAGLRGRTRLRFELRGRTQISTARGRTIHLPIYRVVARTAPYLHEIAHALLPCRHAPSWFSEGLACFLESSVSERGAGYDSHLFTPNGNSGVHADAARWLADPRGQMVLPFAGTRGAPPGIVADRHNVAAPFYVLSHSLVKFLADQVGLPTVIGLARAHKFVFATRRLTGQTTAAWRGEWLEMLRAPREPVNPPGAGTPAADTAP
jgi:hypothetical protein